MKKSTITLIASSMVFIEWLEYSLYLYLASIISKTLLPSESGNNALFMTFGIFTISYLARPLGGLIFGLYSDSNGRKFPLIVSAFLIAISTIGIGLIPSYQSIGILAPILLLFFRLLQSFSVAGEFNNASIFLMEHATTKKTLAGSFIGMASSAGMFIGGLFAYLISLSPNDDISWRYAYIIVGIFSFFMMLFRQRLTESPIYLELRKSKKTNDKLNILYTLKNHFSGIIKIFILASFMSVYIYTCNIFYMTYLVKDNIFVFSKASQTMMLVQGLVTFLTPIFALIAEKYGFRKLFLFSTIIIMIMAPSLFYGANFHLSYIIYFGLLLYVIGNTGITAIIFRLMYDLLPASVRCSGTSLSWSLGAALLGSSAPILATYFIDDLALFYLPSFYVILLGLLSFFIVIKK